MLRRLWRDCERLRGRGRMSLGLCSPAILRVLRRRRCGGGRLDMLVGQSLLRGLEVARMILRVGRERWLRGDECLLGSGRGSRSCG